MYLMPAILGLIFTLVPSLTGPFRIWRSSKVARSRKGTIVHGEMLVLMNAEGLVSSIVKVVLH